MVAAAEGAAAPALRVLACAEISLICLNKNAGCFQIANCHQPF